MWLFVDSRFHSMEFLFNIRSLFCLCLLHVAASDTTALNIVVRCNKTNDLNPENWYTPTKSNPSPLHDLKVQLTSLTGAPASPGLNITWSINIDSSIHSIQGTLIRVDKLEYRCQYQPQFTSKQVHTGDLEQLGFHFITTDFMIEPSGSYDVIAYNLPPAPLKVQHEYRKMAQIQVPGCDNEWMKDHSTCLNPPPTIKVHWDINIERMKDEIQVTFDSYLRSEKYEIRLRRRTHILRFAEVKARGEIETLTAKLKYSGPCENLSISITPFYDHCGNACNSVYRKIDCQSVTPSPATTTEEPKEHETSVLLISIGCAVAIILLFICLFWRLWRKSGYSKHGLDTAGSVGVLVVYPAVDSMFQNVVMAIADFLQSYRELNVIIDVWQRGSLAEQGPLRWLHSQVSCAEKVLIILPPQHTEFSTNTACLKPNIASVTSDYTVPASACELFSLALNLVASCAHDSQQHQKFLVVHLDHGGQGRIMPVELRGCKTLILPRDLEKLHQLSSRRKVTISGCRSKSYPCKETARKVRDAVQQLDK
ncbi:interleukin-17 receptor B isoform X2 [Neoarius graeffei]|uniref:interleukin-17 receptor B isoform X2 n=1 Tax=Neoarius graeffei TaxID=443677 RepID=UPI00298D3540|nr:interleukin-17 receptor B isoform X2 [Neoarius graeffei]